MRWKVINVKHKPLHILQRLFNPSCMPLPMCCSYDEQLMAGSLHGGEFLFYQYGPIRSCTHDDDGRSGGYVKKCR